MELRRLQEYLPKELYSRDAGQGVAFRIDRAGGGVSWVIDRTTLTLRTDTPGSTPTHFPLSLYTVGGLANAIAAVPGLTVSARNSEVAAFSARILLPGSGDRANGVLAATNPLTLLLSAWGESLSEADLARGDVLQQMNVRTAGGFWVDVWGSYFGVVRRSGEPDATYALRIIAEILRPRVNKYAIESAITEVTGEPVSIYEPWTDLLKLSDRSTLSGSARLYDGKYWSYNTLDVRSEANISETKPIVLRNKAAGIIAWFQQIIKIFGEIGESLTEGAFAPDLRLIMDPQHSQGWRLSEDLILSGDLQVEVIGEKYHVMALDSPPGYSYTIDPVYDIQGRRYSPRTAGNTLPGAAYNPQPPGTAGSSSLGLKAGGYWPLPVLFTLGYKAGANTLYANTVAAIVPACEFVVTQQVAGATQGIAVGVLPTVIVGAPAGVGRVSAQATGAGAAVTLSAPAGQATGSGAGFASGALPLVQVFAPTGSARSSGNASGTGVSVRLFPCAGAATGGAVAIGDLATVTLSAPAGGALGGGTLFGDALVDSELFWLSPSGQS